MQEDRKSNGRRARREEHVGRRDERRDEGAGGGGGGAGNDADESRQIAGGRSRITARGRCRRAMKGGRGASGTRVSAVLLQLCGREDLNRNLAMIVVENYSERDRGAAVGDCDAEAGDTRASGAGFVKYTGRRGDAGREASDRRGCGRSREEGAWAVMQMLRGRLPVHERLIRRVSFGDCHRCIVHCAGVHSGCMRCFRAAGGRLL